MRTAGRKSKASPTMRMVNELKLRTMVLTGGVDRLSDAERAKTVTDMRLLRAAARSAEQALTAALEIADP